MYRRIVFNVAIALSVAVLMIGNALATTYTVGPAAAGCQYQDIGAAVAAAKANPGPDLIKLASISFTPTTPIVVQDSGDLTIEGGYGTCGASVPLFDSTIDGTFMSPAAYLIVQGGGGGALTLRWLQLRNSSAGAIDSVLSGPLTLEHVQVYSNNADYGAGIFISGNSIFRPQLTLSDTAIYDNVAKNGAGLYLNTVDVKILGNFELRHNQALNAGAGDGGGIWSNDADIDWRVHGNSVGIKNNHADHDGGGVWFSHSDPSGYYELHTRTDDGKPFVVDSNSAGNRGGGFYLSVSNSQTGPASYHLLYNTHVTGNSAADGAAFYVYADAGASGVSNQLLLFQSNVGDAAKPCATGVECNAIDGNTAGSGGSIVSMGAAHGGTVVFTLSRGRMRGNTGDSLITGRGVVYVFSSLLASNQLSNLPIANNDQPMTIENSTIAANTMPASVVAYSLRGALRFERSIIDQPGAYLCAAPMGTVTTRDLMLSPSTNSSGATGSNIQVGLPSFVNPGAGDFHLQFNSEAIDRWANSDLGDPSPPDDLDGALLPHATGVTSTPYDFGAYEYGAKVDKITVLGFEAP